VLFAAFEYFFNVSVYLSAANFHFAISVSAGATADFAAFCTLL
jgi:hypothetical protein